MKSASSFGLITNRKNYYFHSANDREGGAVYVLPTLLQSMLQYTPSVPNNFQIVQYVSKRFVMMESQKKSARDAVKKVLSTKLDDMIITTSLDGAALFGQNKCCGILDSDSTQHYPYALKIDIVESCPFGPSIMTVDQVDKLARRYMRGRNVDLNEKYELFMITDRRVNIAKANALKPKWKAVIEVISRKTKNSLAHDYL